MRSAIVLFQLALASIVSSSVARADVENDPQIWTAVLGTAKPTQAAPKLRLWLDTHLRRSDAGLVHIARPAVGWSFAPWLSAWAGYAWVPVVPDDGDTVNEHRAWQQVVVKHQVGKLSLQSRTRFELRFSDAGDDMGLRIREFVRIAWQPWTTSGVVMWDELFVGLNEPDWGARRGFDQNRLFVGPFVKLNRRLRVELGYLLLYAERGQTDQVGHVLATNIFWSL